MKFTSRMSSWYPLSDFRVLSTSEISRLESDLGPRVEWPLVRFTRLFWDEELILSSQRSLSIGQYGDFFRIPLNVSVNLRCCRDEW